ncbi:MAG: hypothetical protein WC492_00665 [Candidatus Micrarchaeia archaeon]
MLDMLKIECTKCKAEIANYSEMVQILEDSGITATYCMECGQEARKKIDDRDDSIQ